MMSKKRRSKTLEKAARAVKDDDLFVEHIFNIARGFADHHELDAGAGARGVRRSLKTFSKHASALLEWLERSDERGSPEHEALNAIARNAEHSTDSNAARIWLASGSDGADKSESEFQGKKLKNAPRFAAVALRATFEHHKLKLSLQATEKKQSDAVKLFCAIAKDGGDLSMTPAQARDWLAGSARK